MNLLFRRLGILLLPALILLLGCAKHGIYHSVREGETLYRIGKTYDIDPQYLARTNGIFIARNLKAGQKLFIPGAEYPRKVVPYGQTLSEKKDVAPTQSPKQKPKASQKSSRKRKISTKIPTKTTKKPASIGVKPKFSWPVKGRVLRPYNPKGKIPCRGLEISASIGTAVKSAGAGRVIYSGNGIRGYGNLLILEHENSFFTVYGFNQKNLVQTGSFVGDGEKIALSGRPPDGRSPRLHFEVRKGNEAQNPRLFLP